MRKPRDYAAELKALGEKAQQLKERHVRQLGALVIATGADLLTAEELAGALLAATRSDAATKEAWRKSGAAFFRGTGTASGAGVGDQPGGAAAHDGGAPSPSTTHGAP